MSTTPTKAVPAHLRPENCYVCGHGPHEPRSSAGGHDFWSNADAKVFFDQQDARLRAPLPSMTAVETLDPREAVSR